MTTHNDPADDEPTVAINQAGRGSRPARRRPVAAAGQGRPAGDDEPTVVLGPQTPGVEIEGGGTDSILMLDTVLARAPRSDHEVLIASAGPLLALVAQLRNTVEFANVADLRRQVVAQVERFEEKSLKAGVSAGEVTGARYVMCSLVDETVLTTPWGGRSEWASNSLLNEFHGETWGGEKVFQILDRVRSDPRRYLGLLRLIDMALLLGFEGRFRVIDNGRYQLDDLRSELGRIIRSELGPAPRELSAQWRGVTDRRGLRRYLPLWVVAAAGIALLVALYGFAQYRLSSITTPVIDEMQEVGGGSGQVR